MGFLGMAASGLSFLLIGTWQSFHLLLLNNRSSSSALPLCSSVQSIAIATLSLLHIICGLLASHSVEKSSVGFSVPLERSSVALIFFIFAISNLLTQRTKSLPLPKEMLNMMVLYALGQEFLLFYLQRPDAGLESRYYTLLLVPICLCMISIASKTMFPDFSLASLGFAMGLVLQGTWMIQMAFSFFYKGTMAMGCYLQMQGEGDYLIKCNDNNHAGNGSHGHMDTLMRAKAMATLQFNGHMALIIITTLLFFAFTRRYEKVRSDLHALNYEMVSTLDSCDNSKQELRLHPSMDSFSLGFDEEELDQKIDLGSHRDTNGLHA